MGHGLQAQRSKIHAINQQKVKIKGNRPWTSQGKDQENELWVGSGIVDL